MLRGVLFDMDGVLVDSEEFIRLAAISMFRELGMETQHEDFFEFIGAGENRFLEGVAEKYGKTIDTEAAKSRTYEIYFELIKGKLKPFPGVESFIEECKRQGLKTALATSADKGKMEANLREIGLSRDTFDAVVNALDVKRQKPYPDIYLRASELLGFKPEECLVIEDAVNGVAAAKAAGAKCLGITTSFSEKDLYKADWFAGNLAEADLEILKW